MANKATLVNPITRDELKVIVREILQEFLWEYEQQLPDPDSGLEFKAEFVATLQAALKNQSQRGKPHDELMRELGLE